MINKIMLGFISFITILTLSACAGGNNEESSQNETVQEENNDMAGHNMEETDGIEESEKTDDMQGMDHSNMNHSGSGEVPEGLKEAENPTFPVGSIAIIQSDHMPGMKGADATIVGAYDTTVYTVSYTPTTGGEPVTNHKWVIHEELEGADEAPLEPGKEVTINANHMEGMQGATATIDSAEETTVYMIDFTSTTGEQVTNHKWVTESELSAQ
ncbi:YdhK family protein [Ureibacillus sp. MALMAid1270]|uniref:YdhK family protein n=1 Tax=Ureibacillus sp. MALMAid1270 TaxID=3411629 RepID=UPI003BA5D962